MDTRTRTAMPGQPGKAVTAGAEAPRGVEELEGAESPRQPAGTNRLADESFQAGSAEAPLVSLRGSLVLPNRHGFAFEEVRAVLHSEDGTEFTSYAPRANTIEFTGLAGGVYELRVEALGHRHRPQVVDLRQTAPSRGAHTLVRLWPANWVEVRVTTPDGLPVGTLAERLGLDCDRLFLDAFDVFPLEDSATAGTGGRRAEGAGLGLFHSLAGARATEAPGGVIGSFEFERELPGEVGLWIFDRFHDSARVQPGQDSIDFSVDMRALDERLARVSIRVLDRGDKSPLTGARSTLHADEVGLRRPDLTSVAPTAAGVVGFQHIVPGHYTLSVERVGSIATRRLELGLGESLDLGVISLELHSEIPVTVVDPSGSAVHALIELAPHESGARAADLYAPGLHRPTDEMGAAGLPVPEQRSIVRARRITTEGARVSVDVATENVLVDPNNPPAELRLVVREAVEVQFVPRSSWIAAHVLRIEDELGIVVAEVRSGAAAGLGAALLPGTFVIRRFDSQGREMGQSTGLVQTEDCVLECP